MSIRESFTQYIHQLQNEICKALEQEDGTGKFHEDCWERPGGGGGITRIMRKGAVIEKGGVNTSVVHGKLPQSMKDSFRTEYEDFFACGISLVIHPLNPMVPTVHANFRYFELYDFQGQVVDSWFGGGADLTPYYFFEEDVVHFHKTLKQACDVAHPSFYPKYKAECDRYFYISHRNESRGVGGLFFDYCKATEEFSMEFWQQFVQGVGNSFIQAYQPIVARRKHMPYTEKNQQWQGIRRGRYVEFNLVYDRGTLFGLKTNGRIESILMSLPATAHWEYDYQVEPNSPEAEMLEALKHRDWV